MACENLIHPFQNDPGTSQRQRIMSELLQSDAKIDARTLADLLNFFVQFAGHVNYYDNALNVSDWQAFFRKSLPFTFSSIIKYDAAATTQKLDLYNALFLKRPTESGLQLTLYFIYYKTIRPINSWYLEIKDKGLPIENTLRKLISEQLKSLLIAFIRLMNAASKWYCIKKIDFSELLDNEAWAISAADRQSIDETFLQRAAGRTERLKELQAQVKGLFPPFLDAVKILSASPEMEKSLQESLLPLKESFQKNHEPHLGLIFAFLQIFQKLQEDLNGYGKKHLDFFYTDVLKLKSKGAVPDKAHIVFELQNQLKKHALQKGLLVKDGKDINKEEILFALDDEIVVNRTQVSEVRTLFLNNQYRNDDAFVEGVYVATKADKADGIDKDFVDPGPKNYPTLGAKYSKYVEPGKKEAQTYPQARIGFVLASPVLLLLEGTRTINITIACELTDNCISVKSADKIPDPCCNKSVNAATPSNADGGTDRAFIDPATLHEAIRTVFTGNSEKQNKTYVHINERLLEEAVKMGLSVEIVKLIRFAFLKNNCEASRCCEGTIFYKNSATINESDWRAFLAGLPAEHKAGADALPDFFKLRSPFSILLSGKDEWIAPKNSVKIEISALSGNAFTIKFGLQLTPDEPAVTFYDAEKLKEDFSTQYPLVKIELDDNIKLDLPAAGSNTDQQHCCLDREAGLDCRQISLYHYFRHVTVLEETQIEVKVCGVKKNILVQNEEALLDINAPFPPFGSRPKIGSNFYIGNKEIFFKNWQELWINAEWKGRPVNFPDYYLNYNFEPFEDGTTIMDEAKFKIRAAVLEKGDWKPNGEKQLFKDPSATKSFCERPLPVDDPKLPIFRDTYKYSRTDFQNYPYQARGLDLSKLTQFSVNSVDSFLRLSLGGLSFQHDRYAFVLARYMAAIAKLPDPQRIKEVEILLIRAEQSAVDIRNKVNSLIPLVTLITTNTASIGSANTNINTAASLLLTQLNNATTNLTPATLNLPAARTNVINARNIVNNQILPNVTSISSRIPLITNACTTILGTLAEISTLLVNGDLGLIKTIQDARVKLEVSQILNDGTPKEPYTPSIADLSIDYRAIADISDIDLIHLYPYQDTYKSVDIELKPSLFPVHCQEGTLFIALKDLVPGSNVNVLFQLAEATADSELPQEEIHWQYLSNNQWKPLRKGFEVIDDTTDGLTTSGIVKFAIPDNISTGNTIMPKEAFWITASVNKNSVALSETIGIHTQAIRVTFTNREENDKLRLSQALAAHAISKLNVADANIKKVDQPYDSYGGAVPEQEGSYYVRNSELLRHKGRAIQKFDYERLALEAFPQLYRAKCINHSFALNAHEYSNDFPMAPGYVILAVIPDLVALNAGGSFEPKVPVSILGKIERYLQSRTSPFVRLRAMNPRYERIDICLDVRFVFGKDENYYKEKLKQDISEFLAPWALGMPYKLSFGQKVNRSDIIGLLEGKDYIDYIVDFRMSHEEDPMDAGVITIEPKTPRSILIAGEIAVCIPEKDCGEGGQPRDNENQTY